MRTADLHTHFWPQSFLDTTAAGKPWFGWTLETDGGDGLLLTGGGHGPYLVKGYHRVDLKDPEMRIGRRIAEQGIDFEAVMIVGYLWSYHLDQSESSALARDVNDELAALEKEDANHFSGLAHLPLPHTRAAIAEVERCVRDLGLRHFAVASHVNGRNLDDPAIAPVVEAIAEAGGTLSVHPAFFDKIGEHDRLSSTLFRNGLAAPLEAGVALISLMATGVFDRYPDFTAWVSHGGGASMYAMGRFQRRYLAMDPSERPMPHPPKEYLRRFYYGNLVHDDESLRLLLDRVGSDRVTIGTDHPFPWDHAGGSANWIRAADFLSPDDRDNILWRNAGTFLGVDL